MLRLRSLHRSIVLAQDIAQKNQQPAADQWECRISRKKKMTTIEEIAELQMERAVAILELNKLDNGLREIKAMKDNAQNLQHQTRLDAAHRRNLRLRSDQQAKITFLNAQIKGMNARLQRELRDKNLTRAEVQ